MNANYITQAEFTAAHPEADLSQYTEVTISGMIGRASRIVDNITQVDGFDLQAAVDEKAPVIITNLGDLTIFPRRVPVVSVSGIRLHRGSFDLTLTLTNAGTSLLEIPTPGNSIVYPNTVLTSTGTFTINHLLDLRSSGVYSIITYVGGYMTIPDPVKEATILILRDLLNKRLNAAGAASISQGGISIKYSERDGQSDDVTDAIFLLQDYIRRVPA